MQTALITCCSFKVVFTSFQSLEGIEMDYFKTQVKMNIQKKKECHKYIFLHSKN